VIIVDVMNVRGCVPDGWWHDKDGAFRRLVASIAGRDWADEWVIIVADGHPVAGVPAGTTGNVEVRYAGHSAPDAADDLIVEIVEGEDPTDGPVTVVTSDRGLRERLPTHVEVQGAQAFRNHGA
jgi:predicted RNA-binding protein with PIN domain